MLVKLPNCTRCLSCDDSRHTIRTDGIFHVADLAYHPCYRHERDSIWQSTCMMSPVGAVMKQPPFAPCSSPYSSQEFSFRLYTVSRLSLCGVQGRVFTTLPSFIHALACRTFLRARSAFSLFSSNEEATSHDVAKLLRTSVQIAVNNAP